MKYAIETNGLSKFFGTVHAVDSVNLHVEQGEIYGFVGLNGAGKTTTIRALLGMIHPNEGSVRVLGQVVGSSGQGPWRRVGHLVEIPSAYPELTVNENLEIARRLQAIPDVRATSSVIELMGLTSYADRKAGGLSTGNLQRLGLARALLHNPELLILDEPFNGLDPAGVVEVRGLLTNLAYEKGVTVFMSSHILTEVERISTIIGIIHKGHLIEELKAEILKELRSQRLEVKTRDLVAGQTALSQAGFDVKVSGDTLILDEERAVNAPEDVATILVKAGTPPIRLSVELENLEEHFLRLEEKEE
jgi:ABC-2 type transport system ATP-binding protein